jgi:class 3 adenylate cyclase
MAHIEQILNSALFAVPEGLDRKRAKQARNLIGLGVLAGAVHVIEGLLYASRNLSLLAWLNLASLLCYALFIFLTRRGHINWAVTIAWLELSAYLSIFSLLLGKGSGIAFYFPVVIMAAFFMFRPDQPMLRKAWITWFVLLGLVVYFATVIIEPRINLDKSLLTIIFNLHLVTGVGVMIVAAGYFSWVGERAEAELNRERQRSERLLLNILPAPIAERLKNEPGTIADQFSSVSVLFADIVGFTTLSSRISTEALIDILNEIFSRFDRLARKHNLEKIKTIGDAYMVVGGLPTPSEGHAVTMVEMALDMRVAVRDYAKDAVEPIDIRIGINTGPVIAGVIGVEKFAYDLWGDTVNTASRMESHGLPGLVQISEATFQAISDSGNAGAYRFEDRGGIQVKGKGQMRAFFVEREPEYKQT